MAGCDRRHAALAGFEQRFVAVQPVVPFRFVRTVAADAMFQQNGSHLVTEADLLGRGWALLAGRFFRNLRKALPRKTAARTTTPGDK